MIYTTKNTRLTFGQYKNKSVAYIYENDLNYFKWLVNQPFFKKFDYYHIFKNYKPEPEHVKYCNENGIKFCEFCCKKKRKRIHDRGDNFRYCGVCYNGDRQYARYSLLEDTTEYGKKKKQEIKDKINKKQLAEYKKYLKNKDKNKDK